MLSEFDLIARHFAPIAGEAGLGLLDDAALLRPPIGHDLVITTDALAADVHFFADDPPATIGHKALAVNLSDLAAKGADPLGFVLALMLPAQKSGMRLDDDWLAAFACGLGALAKSTACPLIGGDTVSTGGPLGLSITAFGSVPAGRMVRRSGAKPGDRLFVTGTIGDAAIGLQLRLAEKQDKALPLSADHGHFLQERYLRPRPRNAIAAILRDHAHAAMDISDGFAGDLAKMLRLANVGADVLLEDIPHSVAARAAFRHDPEFRETALTGGDDYEVLAAVPEVKAKAFATACLKVGLVVTQVGTVLSEQAPIRFLEADGKPRVFTTPSYVHAPKPLSTGS
ncbi:MAG: thiamine-phosphate kinase [Beijerinckiaceae bacterium]